MSVKKSPFGTSASVADVPPEQPIASSLRLPQARVLAALVPDDLGAPPVNWPLVTRANLGVAAGYTAISGSITRALNGVAAGNTINAPHSGLLSLGLVEESVLDVEGVTEVNYRITAAGVLAYQTHLARNGNVPEVREAAKCTNARYRKL